MAENKIIIDINLNASGESGSDATKVADNQNTSTAKKESEDVGKSLARQGALYIGKQAVQWGISNYGNLTGDTITQANIQTGVQLGAMLMTVVKSPIMGSLAVISSVATQVINYELQQQKNNQDISQLRTRVGGIITSGGRE